jgi:hypothetical protein
MSTAPIAEALNRPLASAKLIGGMIGHESSGPAVLRQSVRSKKGLNGNDPGGDARMRDTGKHGQINDQNGSLSIQS